MTDWKLQETAQQTSSLNQFINSPELDELIDDPLSANPNLQQTILSLKIIQAQYRQATADRLPEDVIEQQDLGFGLGLQLTTYLTQKLNWQHTNKPEQFTHKKAVVMSVGYHPNSDLAQEAGLTINKIGFINVNEYMKTENPDISAVGDCAEKFSLITRTPKRAMLASTACAKARLVGMNILNLSPFGRV